MSILCCIPLSGNQVLAIMHSSFPSDPLVLFPDCPAWGALPGSRAVERVGCNVRRDFLIFKAAFYLPQICFAKGDLHKGMQSRGRTVARLPASGRAEPLPHGDASVWSAERWRNSAWLISPIHAEIVFKKRTNKCLKRGGAVRRGSLNTRHSGGLWPVQGNAAVRWKRCFF